MRGELLPMYSHPPDRAMWSFAFNAIYLINLPHRNDRLNESITELTKYKIPFIVWPATQHEDGRIGIRMTLTSLLENALRCGMKRILVFEDDVKFIRDPNVFMHDCLTQLHQLDQWDLFYLGVNTHKPFDKPVAPNLLRVDWGYSLHAVAYSESGMNKALHSFREMPDAAVDVCLDEKVQKQGMSYCAYPMLATQRNSYSDIEKKAVYQTYIEDRFNEHTKHLK